LTITRVPQTDWKHTGLRAARKPPATAQAQKVRSQVRHWMVSAICRARLTPPPPDRRWSGDTLGIRSWARALSPCFAMARFRRCSDSVPSHSTYGFHGDPFGRLPGALRSPGEAVELDLAGPQNPRSNVSRAPRHPTSMKRAGKLDDVAARAIVTLPSSRG